MFSEKNYRDAVEDAKKTLNFAENRYELTLETNQGAITLEFFPEVAPNHVANILALSAIGFYDGLSFHRIVKDFVIQGGCPKGTGSGGPGYNVKAEFNDRKHVAGTLSMARAQDPHSAGSQFFVCLGTHGFLDKNYTVFGQTKDQSSLDVVIKIGKVATDSGDRPKEAVIIQKATVQSFPL